ncbi:MAG TPA: type II toxin-antitoxin system prevent-host-death family antitoxin [Hanamia sp.]
MKMNVISFSALKKDFKSTFDKVSNDKEIVIVSKNKKRNVVLISLKDYNSIQETFYLLSTEKNRKRLEESINEIKEGKFYSHLLIED